MSAAREFERGPPDRMPLLGGGQVEARVEVENLRELGAALRDAVRHAIAEREELVRGNLRVGVGAVDLLRVVQQRDRAPVVAGGVRGARAVDRRMRGRLRRGRAAPAGPQQQGAEENNEQ